MINLCTPTEVIRIVTDFAADVDVYASWIDKIGSACTLDASGGTQITTATTTTVVLAPAASTVRNVKQLSISNRDAADGVGVTVQFYDGTNTVVIMREYLGPGDQLELTDDGTWYARLQGGAITRTFLTVGVGATYTTPPGVRQLFVEAVGGGGGGGGCATAATNSAAAGGGGSGGYSASTVTTPAATYTYTVATGGAGGVAGATGATGNNTTFGATVAQALGGVGGVFDTVATIHVGGLGGNGGAAGVGDLTIPGRAGEFGVALAAAQATSGRGGSSVYGGGGVGRKTTGTGTDVTQVYAYGSGGGGACILSGGGNQTGGTGSGGLIVVTEYR